MTSGEFTMVYEIDFSLLFIFYLDLSGAKLSYFDSFDEVSKLKVAF